MPRDARIVWNGTVFVVGSSAGSVASYVWAPRIFDMFPEAHVHVQLGDSYAPLFGETAYQDGIENWGYLGVYSDRITGLDVGPWRPYVSARNANATCATYSNAMFASYVSQGDPVQTAFYAYEGCGAEKCNWKKAMRKALGVVHTGTRGMHDNFASFVGDSREHEVTINDAMYDVKADGVALSDWIRALLGGPDAWARMRKNVDCMGHGC